MQTAKKVLVVLAAVMTVTSLAEEGYKVLFTFNKGPAGAIPVGGLIVDNENLYGTIREGGYNGLGSIFRIGTNGTGFVELVHFNGTDGSHPNGGLVKSGLNIYGTTSSGGTWNNGVVFKVWDIGSSFSHGVLKNLSTNEGRYMNGGLALNGATLYGTTRGYHPLIAAPGGDTVFKLQNDGTGFQVLSNLTGRNPRGGLLVNGNLLYGSAGIGSSFAGSIYKISSSGMSYTTLQDFSGIDGSDPNWKLVLGGNTLYGTAATGGDFASGILFKVNTNGSDFAILKSFTALVSNTNSDGATPTGGLLLNGNTLYGATSGGGNAGKGLVYKINIDGSGFTVLKHFPDASYSSGVYTNSEGANPNGDLVMVAGTLYGVTSSGGTSGRGVLYSLTVPPEIEQPGVRSNRFGFYVTGASGQPLTVDGCTNLAAGAWSPIHTFTLGSTPYYFSHPQWTNSSQRWYRIRVR